MSGPVVGGSIVIAVLHEAIAHFGSITQENTREVSRWVQNRVEEIRREQGLPVPRPVRDWQLDAANDRKSMT